MKMRFRTDGWHFADMKAAGQPFDEYYAYSADAKKYWDETPKAEPGDVWRIYWSHHEGEGHGPQIDDRIAGYAICCIKCGRVHNWTTAGNCSQKVQRSYKDKGGNEVFYDSCVHNGITSCWTWTGSAEENNLTGSPSLQVTSDECNWHGYIINGNIQE